MPHCYRCSIGPTVSVEIFLTEWEKHTAWHQYVDLVEAIGPGFHPDTYGHEYTTYPDGYDAERIDEVIEVANRAGIDLYTEAVNILEGVYK